MGEYLAVLGVVGALIGLIWGFMSIKGGKGFFTAAAGLVLGIASTAFVLYFAPYLTGQLVIVSDLLVGILGGFGYSVAVVGALKETVLKDM